MPSTATHLQPALPSAVGPVSDALLDHLACRAPRRHYVPVEAPVGDTRPYGHDLQLALYVSYELHHRGFADVDPRWEWDPGVLQFRARLEEAFGNALREDVGDVSACSAAAEIRRLGARSSVLADHLREHGTWSQMREYFVHRSVRRLKIDDAGAWATYAMTPAEFDRSVSGAPPRSTSCRFADVLSAAGLDDTYLHYLDEVTPEALALVNMMSMFGLHRNLRGAATGQLVATEISIRRASAGLHDALLRLGAPQPCVQFYRDHAGTLDGPPRCETLGALLEREPETEPDVVLGIRAFELLEERFASRLLTCWADGRSSLRHLSLR
ncbi:iron-containing redox enzyme family protein [Mycolicibacterium canariasense]|nr:iron-containing redox enzyme family protein [Mycolicibacterium canariasense]ORV05172.1 hypothetical protein AWB94_20510 [Mycolicibacterium canariasense]